MGPATGTGSAESEVTLSQNFSKDAEDGCLPRVQRDLMLRIAEHLWKHKGRNVMAILQKAQYL